MNSGMVLLGHLRHELLEDDLGLGVAAADPVVVLGGDGLLERLEAVEEAVGEVDEGGLVVGGGDELVEVVVHEGGLEAEVLVDVVGGVLAEQVLQRQQVEGRAAQPVRVRREAGADVRHVDAVLQEGTRPCLGVVDLLCNREKKVLPMVQKLVSASLCLCLLNTE